MRTLTLLIVLTTWLTSVATAQVAVRIGKNHELVKRRFRPVIARANQSTVRILTGPRGEDVALGAIVRSDGYVLTRGDGLPKQPTCQLPSGRQLTAARIEEFAADGLVLLRVQARGLPVVPWRQGPAPPLGSLLATPGRGPDPVAVGIVSSRSTPASGASDNRQLDHDSILRPVDCGGPVVDLSGLAIGLNCARTDRVTTVALSADAVRDLLDDLNKHLAAVQGEGAGPRQSVSQAPPVGLNELQAKIRTAAAKAVVCTVAVQIGAARGSGVIASPEGYVLTAAHVIPAADQKATIRLASGKTTAGTCRGSNRTADAGLIQLDTATPWPHADTSRWPIARRGQWCIATGYPHGRRRDEPPVVRFGRVLVSGTELVITDCTLTQGDSGGPLFDLDGRLLGIHSRVGQHLARNVHVPIGRFRTDWPRLKRGEVWGQPLPVEPAQRQ